MIDSFKKWPIRKQIMSAFLSLIIIMMCLIFTIIFINMDIINKMCTEGIATSVTATTKTNMNMIAAQKGNYIEHLKAQFGNNMFIFKFLYDEIYGFKNLENFTWSPSENYTQAYNSSPNLFTSSMSDFYGENPVSYEKSCIWNAKESVDSLEGEFFKATSQQLDRFYHLFQTPFFANGVQRVNVIFLKNNSDGTATKLLRVWPCQTILNESYKLDDLGEEGTWRYSSFAYYTMKALDPSMIDYPFIILSGPYKDKMNYRYPTCSFNTLLVMNNEFVGIMQIEIRNSYFFYEIFKNLTFLNTGVTIFFNLFAQIIAPAPTWTEVNPINMTQNLFDVYQRTGMEEAYFNEKLYNRTKNTDELRIVKVLNEYYQLTDYYESTVFLPYNFQETTYKRWEFGIILYVQKSEIESIQETISSTIKKHTSLVFAIGLMCCALTAAVIIVFSFNLASSISKPLKNVINVANFINDNAGNKEAISQIISDVGGLPEGDFQLKVLIRSFKNFIGIVEGSDKKNQTRAIVKPCFYPLNQFNRQYLEKAKKGVSPINWYAYIEKIESKVDEDIEEFDFLDD